MTVSVLAIDFSVLDLPMARNQYGIDLGTRLFAAKSMVGAHMLGLWMDCPKGVAQRITPVAEESTEGNVVLCCIEVAADD